jgi:hypothetical protein
MPTRASLRLFVLSFGLCAQIAHAEQPLSAINWLSKSVVTPAGAAIGKPQRPKEAPIVKGGALPQSVAVVPLDQLSPDGVGLLAASVTGLPHELWGLGREIDIAAQITAVRTEDLPALQGLLMTELLAETAPPVDSSGKGQLLMARIDKLLAMGALDQAASLIDIAGKMDADLFRRAFDVALLTGNEDKGCELMRSSPHLAPTFPARIFCLARSGDWNAAALTLRTAQALGYVSEGENALLSRFLDPDLYEGEVLPPIPQQMTPLSWRMFEAIGEPQGTSVLPLAFAHAELRDAAGWKAQIEAAERLTRVGAISPNVLLGLYTERLPAASGGVWDRVSAFQDFDAALRKKDIAKLGATLPVVWQEMSEAELEVPFAMLFSDALGKVELEGDAGRIAFDIGLLSTQYEAAARARTPSTPRDKFLAGVALGNVGGTVPQDSLGRAIAPAFVSPQISGDFVPLMEERRLGEAILLAMNKISTGVQGNLTGVTEGLSFLRAVGLDDVARRTALELLLLERRG